MRIKITSSILFCLIISMCITTTSFGTTDVWFKKDDDTVVDVATALIWQRTDDNSKRNYTNALSYCRNLDLANYSGWRLPNIKELSSIVDLRRTQPAIDSDAFSSTKSEPYWTSTPFASDSLTGAWFVHFWDGTAGSTVPLATNYVRCVRSQE